jgi:hypothetical protein
MLESVEGPTGAALDCRLRSDAEDAMVAVPVGFSIAQAQTVQSALKRNCEVSIGIGHRGAHFGRVEAMPACFDRVRGSSEDLLGHQRMPAQGWAKVGIQSAQVGVLETKLRHQAREGLASLSQARLWSPALEPPRTRPVSPRPCPAFVDSRGGHARPSAYRPSFSRARSAGPLRRSEARDAARLCASSPFDHTRCSHARGRVSSWTARRR